MTSEGTTSASVILIVIFPAVLEQAQWVQQFWYVDCKINPNIDQENKYLVFFVAALLEPRMVQQFASS